MYSLYRHLEKMPLKNDIFLESCIGAKLLSGNGKTYTFYFYKSFIWIDSKSFRYLPTYTVFPRSQLHSI